MATYKEVGKNIDLQERRVSALVKKGIIPASKGPGGLNLDECRYAYIRYLRAVKSGRAKDGSSNTGSYEEERIRLVKAQADAQDMKNDKLRGSLLESEDVENEWVRISAITRANLLTVPTKAAMDCYHADSIQDVQGILKKVIYEVLTELSNAGD